ncbi:diacylglycerol O-acyltransferase 1 [Trebouxia sp. C0009 RCD-2024]
MELFRVSQRALAIGAACVFAAGTISLNFITPVVREFCLMHGMCDVRRDTMVELLSTPGRAVMVAIGGAAEALLAAPGTTHLILNKRKGFVRVALTTGAHLVPVLSFGENDIFDPIAVEKHSLIWYSQQLTKTTLGFCVPLFMGTGLLGYPLGLLPKPRPLVTVVGKPVPVPKWQGDLHSPEGRQLADKYHTLYVTALKDLYNQHKDLYALDRTSSLKLVA